MAAPNSSTTLLTEHFTYRPAALIDDIINSINILAIRATEAVEKGLLSANPSHLGFKIPSGDSPEAQQAALQVHEAAKLEIESGVHQFETLLEAKIDRNFDKFEVVALRNILNVDADVRDWVRLSHYEGLDFTEKEGDDLPSSESVTLQRKKLREMQKLQALLVAEKAKNAATLQSLRALIMKKEPGAEGGSARPAFAFLQNRGELTGDVNHPVTTSTSFALSQIAPLKSMLEDLKPRLEELANGSGAEGLIGEEEKSWRKERLEFVEKETRRHLEDVRGLELGEMGEIRDGEWQGEGRKLGKGEVEDLERVVSLVGGGDEGEAMDQSK